MQVKLSEQSCMLKTALTQPELVLERFLGIWLDW